MRGCFHNSWYVSRQWGLTDTVPHAVCVVVVTLSDWTCRSLCVCVFIWEEGRDVQGWQCQYNGHSQGGVCVSERGRVPVPVWDWIHVLICVWIWTLWTYWTLLILFPRQGRYWINHCLTNPSVFTSHINKLSSRFVPHNVPTAHRNVLLSGQ